MGHLLGDSIVGLMSTSSHTTPLRTAAARAPWPATGHCWHVPPQETLRHSKAGMSQSLVEVTALFPGSWWTQGFVCVLRVSLAPMSFDLQCDCTPPTILLQLLFCPWMWVIFFFGGILHSPYIDIFLSIVVQQPVAILMFLLEKMSTSHSNPPSW